jgi:hypothetical protein
VTPAAGASPASFIAQWRTSLQVRNARYYNGSGFGYGADMNGLAEQSQPTSGTPISYPFRSFDGRVTFTREQWGQRVFDLNTDGVANYGMYPDWLQELQVLAGRPIVADMFRGAEAYLQMWERAYGVPATGCMPARAQFGAGGLGALRLGDSAAAALYAAGQPSARPGRSYRYCTARSSGGVAAVFGRSGRVALVLSSARGYGAGGRRPGDRVRSLRSGVVLGAPQRGGWAYVAGVVAGRVRYVGVAAAGSRAQLLGDIRAAGLS